MHAAPSEIRKSQTAPSRQRLITLMQQVHFGRIEQLRVEHGEPLFDPPPHVTRTLKMNGQNKPRFPTTSAIATDFPLKAEVVELLEHLARLGDGVVKRIEIAHGMPLLAEIQDTVTA